MTPRLHSLTVEDFRSIKGQITLPLNAPIVLIHGQNGVGKTSVLSGLELALTGEIQSLQKMDPQYASHLVHYGKEKGRVTLLTEGYNTHSNEVDITLHGKSREGTALLREDDIRQFTERCYLAQSTLSRLLEIYQHKDKRQIDSPLTLFIKDLLGLDRLDNLVQGLYMIKDIRRVRANIPEYKDAEEQFQEKTESLLKVQKNLENIITQKKSMLMELQAITEHLKLDLKTSDSIEQFEKAIQGFQSEELLISITQKTHELAALRSQWEELQSLSKNYTKDLLMSEEQSIRKEIEEWRSGNGILLENEIQSLRKLFPELPSAIDTDPEFARSTASETVAKELHKSNLRFQVNHNNSIIIANLDAEVTDAKDRLTQLENKITDLSGFKGELTEALAQLLSHIEDNHCPVCERDFAEVSDEPLLVHLSQKVTNLKEQAGYLQALLTEKNSTLKLYNELKRKRDELFTQQFTEEEEKHLKKYIYTLQEHFNKLEELLNVATQGVKLQQRLLLTNKNLIEQENNNQRLISLRAAIFKLAHEFSLEQIEEKSIEHTIEQLEIILKTRLLSLESQESKRRTATLLIERYKGVSIELEEYTTKEKRLTESIQELKEALKKATSTRENLIEFEKLAQEARFDIVRRVFNTELNQKWRDLFIRMAPEEPFIPAFIIPEQSIQASLETVHRSGNIGGNPRLMLSAGNLNTAALTLFIALHLSVEARLPWLILDDPVQSMDEIHISQFSALLRTLSRQMKRQIVIAVHERPLFEYLCFELSPGFENDGLITIELSQAPDGSTLATSNSFNWEPELAIPQ